jgi:peptide-methionine (S)-S-oxide reductase
VGSGDTGSGELATLGGGCFWCLEAAFQALQGVDQVLPGYAGGSLPQPTYEQVCGGGTGHAEVVQVAFDPAVISYRDLLEVFFTIHDPTTLNRQGADVGTQYRSVVFYHSTAQKETAEEVIAELEEAGTWKAPIVTELTPFDVFYPAEDYHRDYYRQHSDKPYCRVVIEPKLRKLEKKHSPILKVA